MTHSLIRRVVLGLLVFAVLAAGARQAAVSLAAWNKDATGTATVHSAADFGGLELPLYLRGTSDLEEGTPIAATSTSNGVILGVLGLGDLLLNSANYLYWQTEPVTAPLHLGTSPSLIVWLQTALATPYAVLMECPGDATAHFTATNGCRYMAGGGGIALLNLTPSATTLDFSPQSADMTIDTGNKLVVKIGITVVGGTFHWDSASRPARIVE